MVSIPARVLRLAALSVLAALLLSSVAVADELVADGDDLVPSANRDLDFGTVCAGTTTTKGVGLALQRTQTANPQIFQNGSTVTVSVGSVSGTGLSAEGGGTIAVPSNWSTQGQGTLSAAVTADVTLVTSGAGSFSGTVGFHAEGVNNQNGQALARQQDLAVEATIVNCDTTPPTLHLPDDITAEAEGPSGAVVTFTATATDTEPASPDVTCDPASGSTFPLGSTTVTCEATDAAGNTATGTFDVTVVDTSPPAIHGVPDDLTVGAVDADGAVVTYTTPTATDLVDGAVEVACVPGSGSLFPLGSTNVVCSAEDSRGNADSESFTVFVVDDEQPVLVLPDDFTAAAVDASGAPVEFEASASDNVDGPVPVACDPASGSTFVLGGTLVECSATDAAGNTATGSFTVTVTDQTPPVLDLPEAVVEEAVDADGAPVIYEVSATDNVDGAVAVACTPASGSTFGLGDSLVECSAADAAGNTATGSFTVSVLDRTPPELTLPQDQLLEASGPDGAIAEFTVSAVDAVDPDPQVSCDAGSGDTFPLGETTVECRATDAAGNVAMGSFVIEVVDTTPPVLDVPADFTAEATGADGATVTYAVSATDIVDPDPDVACAPAPGSLFPLGSTVVSCTATDSAGNEASGSFTVTVADTTAPEVSIALDGTLGSDNWYTSDVTVTVTATDAVGVDSVEYSLDGGATWTDYTEALVVDSDGDHTVDARATDAAGNTGHAGQAAFQRDATDPDVAISLDPTDPDGGDSWYRAAVEVTVTASDDTSGLAQTELSLDGGDTWQDYTGPVVVTEDGAHEARARATDAAGNVGHAGPVAFKRDATPPSILHDADNDTCDLPGEDGWCRGTQTAGFTGGDAGSGLAPDGAATRDFTRSSDEEGAAVTIDSGAVSDLAGNTNTGITAGPYQIDATAPTVDISLDPADADGDDGWYVSDVTVTVDATDDTSGVGTVEYSLDGGDTWTAYGGAFTIDSDGDHTVDARATDAAGNTGHADQAAFKRDATAPRDITFLGDLEDGSEHDFGTVPDEPTCTAADDTSGLDSCEVSGYDTSVGTHTLVATATDVAGNSATAELSYTVLPWQIQGFYRPVDMTPGVWNAAKGGSTVPLKFQVFQGEVELTDVSAAVAWHGWIKVSCADGAAESELAEAETSGNTTLRYDSKEGQFVQNWQLPKQANACYRYTVTTHDGSKIEAQFRLR